jgi:hypothetical protein
MMTKHATTIDPEIHALTTAEIARKQATLAARLREIVSERADDYRKAVKSGPSPVFDADERAARDHARHLLNGAAPESLALPPEIARDRILLREQRGIELAMKILSSKDLVARATEAVQWAEANAERWKSLCRETVLTANKLEALERSAQDLLGQCPDVFAINLPMANAIGGRPIYETPVNELTEAALAAGVVTPAEVKKAKS